MANFKNLLFDKKGYKKIVRT